MIERGDNLDSRFDFLPEESREVLFQFSQALERFQDLRDALNQVIRYTDKHYIIGATSLNILQFHEGVFQDTEHSPFFALEMKLFSFLSSHERRKLEQAFRNDSHPHAEAALLEDFPQDSWRQAFLSSGGKAALRKALAACNLWERAFSLLGKDYFVSVIGSRREEFFVSDEVGMNKSENLAALASFLKEHKIVFYFKSYILEFLEDLFLDISKAILEQRREFDLSSQQIEMEMRENILNLSLLLTVSPIGEVQDENTRTIAILMSARDRIIEGRKDGIRGE